MIKIVLMLLVALALLSLAVLIGLAIGIRFLGLVSGNFQVAVESLA